jgi:putative Holliday junction resolvase
LLKVQQKETLNDDDILDKAVRSEGRVIALDPGTVRIGCAISDEMRLIATPLAPIARQSWKKLLAAVKTTIAKYDAAVLVVGLPLNTDGSESPMSSDAREMARKFALSVDIPVVLQDERVTSYEARKRLWDRGLDPEETRKYVDSEAAAIILADYLDRAKANK